jgi:hypothetical protein
MRRYSAMIVTAASAAALMGSAGAASAQGPADPPIRGTVCVMERGQPVNDPASPTGLTCLSPTDPVLNGTPVLPG